MSCRLMSAAALCLACAIAVRPLRAGPLPEQHDLDAAIHILQTSTSFFDRIDIEVTDKCSSTDKATNREAFTSNDKLHIIRDRPKYYAMWETNVANEMHKQYVATYDGQFSSLMSTDLTGPKKEIRLGLGRSHPAWISHFYFLHMLGIRSFEENETAEEWFKQSAGNREVRVSAMRDKDDGHRLTVTSTWKSGRESYILIDSDDAVGIVGYELSSGTPPTAWTKIRATKWDVVTAKVIPRTIEVEVVNSSGSMTELYTVLHCERPDKEDGSIFQPLKPPRDCIVVDAESQEAYHMKNGEKKYVPFMDPVTGAVTTGPQPTTQPSKGAGN